MENDLLPVINSYFKEMSSLEGKLYIIEYFIKNFSKQMENDLSFNHGSTTLYRDLSIPKKQPNLFPTGYEYNVDKMNLEEEIKNILSREFCITLSQAYEIFETFLISILTEFFSYNRNHTTFLNIRDHNLEMPKSEIREKIRLEQKRNNKGLISIIRKLSDYFKRFESNNTWKENISNWFDLLSEIRHCVVHGRQVFSDRLSIYLKKHNADQLCRKYFSKKTIDDETYIFQNHQHALKNIDLLNEFAFLIFKSLSLDNGLDATYSKC